MKHQPSFPPVGHTGGFLVPPKQRPRYMGEETALLPYYGCWGFAEPPQLLHSLWCFLSFFFPLKKGGAYSLKQKTMGKESEKGKKQRGSVAGKCYVLVHEPKYVAAHWLYLLSLNFRVTKNGYVIKTCIQLGQQQVSGTE